MSVDMRLGREEAMGLHRQGHLAQARVRYEALLAADPDNDDIVGLLALVVEAQGDPTQAEALLLRSLKAPSAASLAIRNANNLVVMLHEAGRQQDAGRVLAELDLPVWPSHTPPDEIEQQSLMSLFQAMVELKLVPRALSLIHGALPFMGAHPEFLRDVAGVMLETGEAQEAHALAAGMDPQDTPDGSVLILQAASAFTLGDLETARQKTEALSAQLPVLWNRAQATQRATIAVLSSAPSYVRTPMAAFNYHYNGNFPSQLAERMSDRFRFVSILANPWGGFQQPLDPIKPHIVLNNFVNAEVLSTPGTLEAVTEAAGSLAAPVVNPPAAAIQMTRQKNAQRFALIPGITAPRVLRFHYDPQKLEPIVREIVATLGTVVIIRTVSHQMGAGTTLCEGPDAIRECLSSMNVAEFYAIEYIASPHKDGLYRQMRMVFVNGAAKLIRADYCDHWNVRARRNPRSQEFYERRPEMMQQANSVVNDPRSWLDAGALARAQSIASMVPLQVFGMDFDINEQGQVVIFEVNATMNFLTTTHGATAYPETAERELLDMMERFFVSYGEGGLRPNGANPTG